MTGFLDDDYGVADARREKVIKRILVAAAIVIIAGLALFFGFRNFREKRQVERFVEFLRQNDYPAAYRLWGCTPERPCRDYPIEEFMKDWGPASPHADVSNVKITRTRSCSTGIIQTLDFGRGEEVNLWVERKDRMIGFAPWPVCSPKMKAG